MFSDKQIQDILRVISFQHVMFIGKNLGTDVLSDFDKYVLNKYGIDPDKLVTDFTPVDKAFYFGKLSLALQDKNSKKLTYNDFLKYLRRGQYEGLNDKEKQALKFVKQNSYGYIKGLENAVLKDVNAIIVGEGQKRRSAYEAIIKDSIKSAIMRRDTVRSVMSEIGNRTGDWQRNLARIAETEMQRAFEYGRFEEIKNKYGDNVQVYKEVFPLACRHCIRLYLTDGVGSQPRLFTLAQLEANGNNMGRKSDQYLATIDPVHPYCRCLLKSLPKGMKWDEGQKKFTYQATKVIDRPKLRLVVGDKEFYV